MGKLHFGFWPSLTASLLMAASGRAQAEGDAGDGAPDAPPAAPETAPEAEPADPFRQHVERSIELHAAGRFAEALAETEQALALAPPEVNRGTLEFNAGACLFELKRYREAAARFVRAAQADPLQRSISLLNAGFAAFETGDLTAARRYAAQVPADDQAHAARRARLLSRIEQAESVAATAARRATLKRGFEQARAREYRAALETLRPDLCAKLTIPAEQADCHYVRALALHQLDELDRAQRVIRQAIALAPGDAPARLLGAEIALRRGDWRGAEADAEAALELGLDHRNAQVARQLLAQIHRLPERGVGASVYLGLGYDSDAAQSGATSAAGVTVAPGGTGSPMGVLVGDVGYAFHLSTEVALRPYYALDLIALSAPDVRELSLQAHEAGARLHWSPSPRWQFRFSGAAELWLVGIDPVDPFTFDGVFEGRLDVSHGKIARGRATLEIRPIAGLDGRDYLSGARSSLELREWLQFGVVTTDFGLGVRWNAIGTLTSSTGQFGLPPCAPITPPGTPPAPDPCGADGVYEIPLGYVAPLARVGLAVDATSFLRLGTSARFERRRYVRESFIAGLPPSNKRRADTIIRIGADGTLALDSRARYSLVARYDLVLSRSNVQQDLADPEHVFDYGNRSYTQHVVELGALARF